MLGPSRQEIYDGAVTVCHELSYFVFQCCVMLFYYAFLYCHVFSVPDSAWRLALDCYRSYVTFTCHLSPPSSPLLTSTSLRLFQSLFPYVRCCQTEILIIRFSLRSPPYFISRLSCPPLTSLRPSALRPAPPVHIVVFRPLRSVTQQWCIDLRLRVFTLR